MYSTIKRVVVGSPLESHLEGEQRLGKPTPLAVFASDAISSTAYATQEILVVLVPLAGMAALDYLVPLSLVVIVLLVIVVTSYHQTIHAYPNGEQHSFAEELAKRNGFRYLDLIVPLQACRDASPEVPIELDNFHPSAAGHRCIAEAEGLRRGRRRFGNRFLDGGLYFFIDFGRRLNLLHFFDFFRRGFLDGLFR